MEFHPAAEAFPIMNKTRLAELQEDIKKHGLREPITLCDGMILDGRNRYKACMELGITPETRIYEGNPWDFTWSCNGQRRDLDADQRYLIWKFCSEQSDTWKATEARIKAAANQARSEAAKEQPRTDEGLFQSPGISTICANTRNHEKGQKAKAAASKTNRGAVARGDKLAKDRPDLAEKVRKGDIKPSQAYKTMQKEAAEKTLLEAQAKVSEVARKCLKEVCDIRHCSMQELLGGGISPDCIITDPPYKQEYLLAYKELAELSREIPLVAVMCGQSYFPEVLALMNQYLQYRWVLAYLTPGGQAVQQWQAKVNTFWKPVLLFGKATNWIGDVCKSEVNDNDKRFHNWGQSESGMLDLVERLTKPGQLICDPFLGAGTTAVVSLLLGRKFVGCDTDEAMVQKSISRCELIYAEVS